MTVFLMPLVLPILIQLLDTWFCLEQSLIEQVILKQDLGIAMGYLADTQRFGKQLPFSLTDQW